MGGEEKRKLPSEHSRAREPRLREEEGDTRDMRVCRLVPAWPQRPAPTGRETCCRTGTLQKRGTPA